MNAHPTFAPDSGVAAAQDDDDDGAGTAGTRAPSKTRRKQAMHDLQALGEALVALPDERIEALALDERLFTAIRDYRGTRTHEGRRRQMQYIGKLMRGTDPQPVREAVAAMQLGRAHDALALHAAERWRAELLASDDAVGRWRAEHPHSDLQQLRSLVRAARKDAAAVPEQRSGRAFRELFRFIRRHDEPAVARPGATAASDGPPGRRDV
jgi:ribosome-associated protein